MKEAAFVKENAQKWKQFEAIIKDRSRVSADEIADNYIRVTDDLAYASTFYPGSNTTKYLNQLSRSFHSGIYQNKREKTSRIGVFFKKEVPLAVYQSHPQLFYALVFFLLAIVIGTISSLNNEQFIRYILSDEYVNMSLENMAKGDPMAVYKGMNPGPMFVYIAVNNIFVAFRTFILGIIFSVGAVQSLVSNGIMVGAFITLFAQKGLLKVAMLSIFLHGALELSAIVIAGGAGIVLGNSVLFPGTYSRTESVVIAGKRAMKIAVGLVPVFVLAAIFESFVTRHYSEFSVGLSLFIILSSFGYITWYYIVLPLQLKNKYGWKR